MKKFQTLYKALVVVVATVLILVLANVALAVDVTPNFDALDVDGAVTIDGGLKVGSTLYTPGTGQIRTQGTIFAGGYISAAGYVSAPFIYSNTLRAPSNTLSIYSGTTTLSATNTDFNVDSLTADGNVTTIGGSVVTDQISSTTGATGTITVAADTIDASDSDIDALVVDTVAANANTVNVEYLNQTTGDSEFDGSAQFNSTVYVGDGITFNPLYNKISAEQIGSFYTESDYCHSTSCSGSFNYNRLEVFCNDTDHIVMDCQAYAYNGSNRGDVTMNSDYDNGSVMTWSPGWDSCVGFVDTDESGLYVQALCFDPEGLSSGGYSDPNQWYYFR